MPKYTTKDTSFRVDTGSGLVACPGCETIGFPAITVPEIEAGDHDSTEEEFLSDLPVRESFDVVLRWDPASAVHAFLEANEGAAAAMEIGMTGADDPASNGYRTFTGKILNFTPAPAAYKGAVRMATVTIRPGAVTVADAAAV